LNFFKSMYTSFRLEWHLDDKTYPRTPEFFWWSCKAVNELLVGSNRLLAASPRPRSPKEFGGFCFQDQTVLHTIARPQPGGVEEKGHSVCHWLGGSSRTIRATGRIVKLGAHRKSDGMTIPSGGETLFLSTLLWGRGVFG
jgi:hypothetical protein